MSAREVVTDDSGTSVMDSSYDSDSDAESFDYCKFASVSFVLGLFCCCWFLESFFFPSLSPFSF